MVRAALAALLAVTALGARPLDVVLHIDAPRAVAPGFHPPFQVAVSFLLEDGRNGLKTFAGRCAWADPAAALDHRWKGALVLTPSSAPRALKTVRYAITDQDGRTVADFLPRDPATRIHAEALSALILHLKPGVLGRPGGALDHQVELAF